MSTSSQQQIQRVQQEKQNFIDAYNQGKISLDDMKTAVAYSDRQLRELNYQPQVQAPEPPGTRPKTSAFTYVSPNQSSRFAARDESVQAAQQMGLPQQLGEKYDLREVTAPAGTKVTYREEQLVGPLQADQPRPTTLILDYGSPSKGEQKQSETSLAIAGKTSASAPLVLINRFRVPFTDNPELAQAQSDILGLSQKGVSPTMQGTRIETGPNYALAYKEYDSIYSNLSAENQIALRAWQDEQAFNQLKRTGLGLGAIIAAPIVGPTGVILGVGGGIGISQGIKTASQALGGEKLTLLTSQEAYEAATAGVLLGGAGKLLSSGLQVAAKGGSVAAIKLTEGIGRGAVKTVTAASSRIGQNALIGGGANFVLSGGDIKSAGQGALFGGALGAVGEVGGALSNRLLGVKTDILKTYTEASQTQMGGKNLVTQRIATVETARIRLPYKEAIRTQKQLEALTDLRLDLAGSRLKTTTIKRGTDGVFEQVTTGPKQTVRSGTAYDQRIGDINKAFASKTTLGESLKTGRLENVAIGRSGDLAGSAGKNIISTTRLAESVLTAAKGGRFEIGRVARGKVNEFAGLPKEVKAVETALGSNAKILETVKVSTGEGQILQLGGKASANKPSVFLEKTTVASKNIFPTETKFTVTKFDTIKLRGSLKNDYSALEVRRTLTGKTKSPIKALPEDLAQTIYKEQGGNYRSIQNKISQALNPKEVKSGPMKPLDGSIGDTPLASRIDANFKQTQASVKKGISAPDYKQITRGSSAMKPGTNEFFKQTQAITEAAKQVQSAGAKGQSVTLSRPVIKLDFAKGSAWTAVTSPKSIWGTQRTAASTATEQRQKIQQPNLNTNAVELNSQLGKLDGKIDLSPIADQTTKNIQRQPELLRTGGTPILNLPKTPRFDETPLPIVFDVPKEDRKLGGGLIPIVGSKPIQSQRDFTGGIRITDTPQKPSQTTDVPQIFRTSNVPKRKLQGLGLFPGGGGSGSGGMFGSRKGKWWKTKSPFPEPGQVFKQVLGKKNIDVFKQVKARKVSKKKRASSGSGNRRSRKR